MARSRSQIQKLDDPTADLVPTERAEQTRFVREFRARYPHLRILAIPNGGMRKPSEIPALKAEGLSIGVPDLFVPGLNLWIEMKRQVKGRLSTEQADWIAYLESVGHRVIVGYGALDALEKVEDVISKR